MSETDVRRTVTLRDVATAAGVSVSTVSRVLDDRLPRSKSLKAEQIRQLAVDLGYRRNAYASGLRRGATATLGVLVPRLTDTVMALLFESIERQARLQGYFAVVATCGDDPEEERKATETLLSRNVDGLILATARLDDELPETLRRQSIPHVLALRSDGLSPSSLGNDVVGGNLAVQHLIDLGHQDIGIVTGPLFTSTARDRLEGAMRALSEAGVSVPPQAVRESGYGIDDGREVARDMLRGGDFSAIFAANDNIAIGVLGVCPELGLVPGSDLSIVGYNDIPLASRLPIPLSSVHTPFDTIASAALELLFDGSDGDIIRHAEPTLVPRASSARAAGRQG